MIKKYIKTVGSVIIIIGVFLISVFATGGVKAANEANNLSELRKELASYKAKMKAAEEAKKKTQSEINSNHNAISVAQTEIENNQKKIDDAKKKIEELNLEIDETEEQIESVLRASEVTKGINHYLEYIFGATSISDFIIRFSISEQVASYSDDLITNYENNITENEQLQSDLARREKELNTQIVNLRNSIDSLGVDMDNYIEDAQEYKKEIAAIESNIKYYENLGCGETESFNTCVQIKADTKFLRPVKSGTITSAYGYRTHPVTGVKNKFHTGIDIGGNREGTNVYAVAGGVVGMVVNRSSCGGNIMYIYHTVNGVKYTSVYMHLLAFKVKKGDVVTNQTVIGTVGGGAGTKSYDKCSTGPHLHLSIAKGWYGTTYAAYSTYVSNLINPVNVISFPNKGTYFYTR